MNDTIVATLQRTAQARSLKMMVLRRDRSIPHLGRKLYHLCNGLACVLLYALWLDRIQALWILALLGGPFVALDIYRLRNPSFNQFVLRVFGPLMRREELKRVSANSYYIIGMFVLVWLFPKSIALLGLLYLAVGDPVAAIVGTCYGKRKLVADKSLEGTLANFFVCAALSWALALVYLGANGERALGLALVGGFAGALAELLPFPVNDNFTIPVFSAAILSVGNQLFALF